MTRKLASHPVTMVCNCWLLEPILACSNDTLPSLSKWYTCVGLCSQQLNHKITWKEINQHNCITSNVMGLISYSTAILYKKWFDSRIWAFMRLKMNAVVFIENSQNLQSIIERSLLWWLVAAACSMKQFWLVCVDRSCRISIVVVCSHRQEMQ